MTSSAGAAAEKPARPILPPGYGARRGLNWAVVGFMYTSFYMCRYNLSIANKAMSDEFGLSKENMGDILASFFYAYAFGQVLNGLFTDRLGGKKAMLIGAAGTVVSNLAFGAASFMGNLWLFSLLWGINGYSQAFGAPGFIKLNASWFSQNERGTFAGVFGFMINLGRVAINQLGPALLAGFVFLGMWQIPPQHWRMLFWVPAGVAAVVAVLLAIFAKDTPEEAGFHNVYKGEADHDDRSVHASMKEVFVQIVTNRFVWIMAAAYSCTGAVPIAIAFVTVAFTVNSTHSLLGPAAAMDIGGRKAAAFASGCINSFQYIGAGVAMQMLGRLLDRTGYTYFFYFMVPWAILGAILMFSMAGQRDLRKRARTA